MPEVRESRSYALRRTSTFKFFPILENLRYYEKSFISEDLTAGLLVGFLHVPQGLAYALLAHVTPISGLYTSILPALIYTVFGTSIHISMGTNSIVSLITAEMIEREVGVKMDQLKALTSVNTNTTSGFLSPKELEDFKQGVAMTSTFVCGIMFLVMGVFRFGFITSYFPSSFVGGFTTAAAFHIGTTQIPKALNVKVKYATGWGKVTKTFVSLFANLEDIHPIDTGIALTTLFLIILFSDQINPRLKPQLNLDIPINLIVIVLGTFVSYEFNLNAEHDVAIIGHIPSGFPSPAMPDVGVMKNVISDSAVIVMVTFSLNISMAILIGRIHYTEVKANKELLAYGMCNLLSSPFQCHVSSTSPTRCMMLHNDNARSMFHSIPTVAILLSVIVGLGPLLHHLPVAVLAGVVLAAIRGLFSQAKHLPTLWKVNKSDFVIWTSTFLVTTLIDIGVGLVFGVAASFAGVVIANQLIEGSLIVKAKHENIFIREENRIGVENLPNIRIFFFPSQLCYFNAEQFKAELFEKVLNPNVVRELSYEVYKDDTDTDVIMEDTGHVIRCIILDCSAMTNIDMDGINMLKVVVLMYHKAAIQILMVRCLRHVYETLDRANFFSVLPKNCVFYDLIDALRHEKYTREGVTLLTKGHSASFTRSISFLVQMSSETDDAAV